jgi:probable blue pigment (indigoidine) exporter
MLVSRLLTGERSARYAAIGEVVLVTLIFGSTLVLHKLAFHYLRPLTTAALRYVAGFLLLLPLMLRRRVPVRSTSRLWMRLFLIGVCFYAVGNGTLIWGLQYIPAMTASLLLSLAPLAVLFGGMLWLKEIPSWVQVAGVIVGLAGSALFLSVGFAPGELRGIVSVTLALFGSVVFGISGREFSREGRLDTLSLTAIPLGFGAAALLPVAFSIEGLPAVSFPGLGIVLWLGVVNAALAYLLYNHALRVLAALEVSVIINLTPLTTALWASLFLDETLNLVQVIGVATVIIGIALVQRQGITSRSSPV